MTFNLRLPGDPEPASPDKPDIVVALIERDDTALIDWILIDSRLCAVIPRFSCRVHNHRSERRNMFVVSVSAPIDCS